MPTHLHHLEAESIHILREVVAECERPVMLCGIGKDSATMLHLARKAFHPGPLPFPLLHVDSTWAFRDMHAMRDQVAATPGVRLIVHRNPDGLKQALDLHGFDAAFGGGRRDEDDGRAQEREFSFRNAAHAWDPRSQRPELWRLCNGLKRPGESIRAFPIGNWTELDVWQYIHRENIPVVPLYFAAPRPVVRRGGTWIMVDDGRMRLEPGEVPETRRVRLRSLGCYPLSGAIESEATTVLQVIEEMLCTQEGCS